MIKNNRKKTKKQNLKIIPLGGLKEVGKNMTAYEYGNDIIVVDTGSTFPEDELLGVDLVIPDSTYLDRNAGKIRAFVYTHGHEDHIGATPYIVPKYDAPIYATPFTSALIPGDSIPSSFTTKKFIRISLPFQWSRILTDSLANRMV